MKIFALLLIIFLVFASTRGFDYPGPPGPSGPPVPSGYAGVFGPTGGAPGTITVTGGSATGTNSASVSETATVTAILIAGGFFEMSEKLYEIKKPTQ